MVGLTNAQTLWLRSLLAFGRQAQHYVLAKCSLISLIIGPYHQSSVRNKTRVVSKSFFFSFFLSIEYTFRQERINTQTHHTEPIRARNVSSRQDSWHVVVFKAQSSRQNSGTFTLARPSCFSLCMWIQVCGFLTSPLFPGCPTLESPFLYIPV